MNNRLTLFQEELFDCFVPEQHTSNRSELRLEKDEGSFSIITEAKDATALRAELNSIMRLLIINDKIDNLLG